jgi:F-type H+-transporting ATPase subunit b
MATRRRFFVCCRRARGFHRAEHWLAAGDEPATLERGNRHAKLPDRHDPGARSDDPKPDHLGVDTVKNQDRRIAHLAALVAFLAVNLVASAAGASGDELEILPQPKMLLILILFFALLVYPMNTLIFKPIFKVLDEREEKTAGTRRHADRLYADAEEVLGRYESSVREVRQEAETARKQTLERARADGGGRTADARAEAEREVARARAEVATALEQARSELRTQSQALAREVAERALGRSFS